MTFDYGEQELFLQQKNSIMSFRKQSVRRRGKTHMPPLEGSHFAHNFPQTNQHVDLEIRLIEA